MAKQPLVSVGIPVYNGAEWIVETVESLLSQTVTDLELVICDNASTDDTERICRQLVARDVRVHYYRNHQNLGAPDNYNATLERAQGVYFKWNSASDICRPELLARCIAVLEADPGTVLAYSNTDLLFDDGHTEKEDDGLALLSDRPSERFRQYVDNVSLNHVMNGVMRRAQLASSMLVQSFYSSDLCLMAEMALYGKFVQLPEYLFVRRNTAETASCLRSGKDLQRYFDPQLKKKMLFQRAKLYRGYFRAVRRSPIAKSEKRVLYRYLLNQLRWSRYHLLGDMMLSVKRIFGRA